MAVDLKAATPDASLPSDGFLFGADSQAAAAPSVFTVAAVKAGLVGGATTQIQFNDGGSAFGGDAGLTYDKTNKVLTLGGGTVTTSIPVLNISQTWNAGGVAFTGLKFNVTNTASSTASLLADLQVGGTSQFKVDRLGNLTITGQATVASHLLFGNTSQFGTSGRTRHTSPADGQWTMTNNAGNDFGRLMLGGTTSSFPAIKRSTTDIHIRLGDDTDYSAISAANFQAAKAYTVATLPTVGTVGRMARVTDGDAALAWGATVVNSGAGATPYLVFDNGTAWTVAGK